MLSCLIHVPFFVTLWTVNPPGSTVHGILQAGILEWLPCPPPGDLPDPGIEPGSPVLQADSLPSESLGKYPFCGGHWLHNSRELRMVSGTIAI